MRPPPFPSIPSRSGVTDGAQVEVEACLRGGGGFTLRVQQQSGGAASDAPAIGDSLPILQQSDCPAALGSSLPVLYRTQAHAVDSGMPMETIRQVH